MIRAALLLLPVVGLGACANQIGAFGGDLKTSNEQLGYAVRHNMAVQAVNQTPSTEPVVASGERTAAAVAEYQADNVEHPGNSSTMTMKASGTQGN